MSHTPEDLETTLETPSNDGQEEEPSGEGRDSANASPHRTPPEKSKISDRAHDEPSAAPNEAQKKSGASLSVVDPAQYEITKEIGQGGMGRVILAKDQRLSRSVAIKELLPVGREAIPRFIREAQVTARLQHPSILPIYELGRWPNGKPFYAMKLIQGKSLGDTLLEAQTMEARLTLLPRVLDACEAMAYAHEQGVIHRDLKPDNIMLGPFGETIIIDWGLAKEQNSQESVTSSQDKQSPEGSPLPRPRMNPGENNNPKLTVAGNIIGTPAYMPLEQAHGQPLDARADVYSLGSILYEVLAGQTPYEGKTTEEILLALHQRPPVPLQERAPRAPKELLAIVSKAMARQKEARYPSAKELAKDLRRFQEGQLVAAYQYTTSERLLRWIKRNKASLAFASLSVAGLLIMGIVSYSQVRRERDIALNAQQKEFESKQREQARADELTLLQAQNTIRRDPAGALHWLSQLSKNSPLWSQARLIAADAFERGLSSVLFASPSSANALSLSTDKARLAIAFDDSLWLYETSTQKKISLSGHSAEVSEVAFSPDGKQLASADKSGQVFLWNVQCALQKNDESCRVVSQSHQGDVMVLLFSPDGARLASAGKDGVIQLSGPAASCVGHTSEISDLAFTANGSRIISSSYDGTLRVWDPDKCNARAPELSKIKLLPSDGGTSILQPDSDDAVAILEEHSAEVITFALSPNERTLYSVSQDRTLRAWNLYTKRSTILHTHKAPLTAITLSRDGKSLFLGGEDGALLVIDPTIQPKKTANKIAINKSCPPGESLTAEGRCRCASPTCRKDFENSGASGSGDILPSDRNGKTANTSETSGLVAQPIEKDRGSRPLEVQSLPGHSEAILHIELSEDEQWIATSGRDKVVKLYSLNTKQSISFAGHQDRVTGLALSPENLISSSWDGTVRAWPMKDSARQYKIPGQPVPFVTWASGPEKPQAIFASGSRLFFWSVGERDAKKLENNDDITALAVSPDQKRVAVGAINGSVRIYPTQRPSASPINTKLSAISHLVFSSTGETLLAGADNQVWRWDGSLGEVLFTIESNIWALAISADARWIAAADGIGNVYLWNLQTKSMQKIAAHNGGVNTIAFSPDGKNLASGGEDHSICLFALTEKPSCKKLSGHSLGVTALSFSRDGERLLSGSFDRALKIWNLSQKTSSELQGHRGKIHTAIFLGDQKTIFSAADDATAFLWDAASGQKRALRTGDTQLASSLSADERAVLLLSRDGVVTAFTNETPNTEEELRAWIQEKLKGAATPPQQSE
jgi:WD40 repeat protein